MQTDSPCSSKDKRVVDGKEKTLTMDDTATKKLKLMKVPETDAKSNTPLKSVAENSSEQFELTDEVKHTSKIFVDETLSNLIAAFDRSTLDQKPAALNDLYDYIVSNSALLLKSEDNFYSIFYFLLMYSSTESESVHGEILKLSKLLCGLLPAFEYAGASICFFREILLKENITASKLALLALEKLCAYNNGYVQEIMNNDILAILHLCSTAELKDNVSRFITILTSHLNNFCDPRKIIYEKLTDINYKSNVIEVPSAPTDIELNQFVENMLNENENIILTTFHKLTLLLKFYTNRVLEHRSFLPNLITCLNSPHNVFCGMAAATTDQKRNFLSAGGALPIIKFCIHENRHIVETSQCVLRNATFEVESEDKITINESVKTRLVQLLTSYNSDDKRAALEAIEILTSGDSKLCEAVFDADLISEAMKYYANGEIDVNVTWSYLRVINNMIRNGKTEHIILMVDMHLMDHLCHLIEENNLKFLYPVLNYCDKILEMLKINDEPRYEDIVEMISKKENVKKLFWFDTEDGRIKPFYLYV